MGINGKMMCAFQPGSYCGNQSEANEKYEELKHIIAKLNLPNWVSVENKDVPLPNGHIIRSIIVQVPDNRNFWFQLTQLPKMLIPYFWKLSDEELERRRMELLANDAWGVEHLKQLALNICGAILTIECYDSCAAGNYNYSIGPDDESSASVHCTSDDGVLNHAEALRKEIINVKAFANALKTKMQSVKICTEGYWGMFK